MWWPIATVLCMQIISVLKQSWRHFVATHLLLIMLNVWTSNIWTMQLLLKKPNLSYFWCRKTNRRYRNIVLHLTLTSFRENRVWRFTPCCGQYCTCMSLLFPAVWWIKNIEHYIYLIWLLNYFRQLCNSHFYNYFWKIEQLSTQLR